MTTPPTIPKYPKLAHAEDYAWLRTKGMARIQELSSSTWTDYNHHDPGVTLLEALCFAITDLGYRADLPIAELIAERSSDDFVPARHGLHSPAEILSINPVTTRDFRKKLIDLDGVKNAWLTVVEDSEPPLHAHCASSTLRFGEDLHHPVKVRGLYDVALELEDDEQLGNVNSGHVLGRIPFVGDGDHTASALIELRLPSLARLDRDRASFPAAYADFRQPSSVVTGPITVRWISGNKTDDADVAPPDRASALKRTLFATVDVVFLADRDDPSSVRTLALVDIPLRVLVRRDSDRRLLPWPALAAVLQDATSAGLFARHHQVIQRADAIIQRARSCLLGCRNLCEDWRQVGAVSVEEVAICADLDVEPWADIEAVVAEAQDGIDQYLAPELRFRSLEELRASGVSVDQIFEGPGLASGFLDSTEVDQSALRARVHGSEIIELLMQVNGVRAVRNFLMSTCDADGRQNGPSVSWDLPVSPGHVPRLSRPASKFLVFKNGLPFLPYADELADVLQVFRGRRSRPNVAGAKLDLEVGQAAFRRLDEYYPVQYHLPRTFGVSPEGLGPSVGVTRLAQAKQLRAYLLFFEQLLANYLAQLAAVKELFYVGGLFDDAGEPRATYHGRWIDDGLLPGVGELYRGIDETKLQALIESRPQRIERRNRLLDHLLSRFADSLPESPGRLYRIYQSASESAADLDKTERQIRLIRAKSELLVKLPAMGRDRFKALDVSRDTGPCTPDLGSDTNTAGLSSRIKTILGLEPPRDRVLVIEHVLLRPKSSDDPLLDICMPQDCDETCGEEDPYSFRLTVVLLGEEDGRRDDGAFRAFANSALRFEVPAHLCMKVCWVSEQQFEELQTVWCAWLATLRAVPASSVAGRAALLAFLAVFRTLKSVHPPAKLHDCAEGNDDNPVFLDRSVITAKKRGSDVSE